jgi:hypothetical protein
MSFSCSCEVVEAGGIRAAVFGHFSAMASLRHK